MGTNTAKLQYLNDTKSLIRQAIDPNNEIITDATPFRQYTTPLIFKSFVLLGKSTQNGTPTPTSPIDIVSLDGTAATLTANGAIYNLPNVGEFRSVPVDSNGNYTDANGQQYICDYIDLIAKKYVQNINSIKIADVPVISRGEFPSGSGLYRFNMYYSNTNSALLPAKITAKGQMCSAFQISSSPLGGNATDNVIVAYSNGGLFARYDTATTVDEFRTFAQSVNLTVQYALKTPLETPLTDEEIDAFIEFQTNLKRAAITNSMGADMKLIYRGESEILNGLLERTITEISSDTCESLQKNALRICTALTKADFAAVTHISTYSLNGCSSLTTLILRAETLCTLEDVKALAGTPIASGTGFIYVPSSLVDSYKAASNWSTYAAQFRAIEDYNV